MNIEPRFLLDEDSNCYGCPEYKHVSETCIQITTCTKIGMYLY